MSLNLGWAGLICFSSDVELGQAFWEWSCSTAILMTWLLRRACFVQARPQWAAAEVGCTWC